jgi:RHS repeat-associated protein
LAPHEITAWPYYANGGYIGLWFIYADSAVLDDFGGGTSASAALPAKHGLAAPARAEPGERDLWAQLRDLFARVERLLTTPRRSALTAPPAGQVWKSYYYAGSQMIALRVEGDPVTEHNGVFFLHGDHLGSTTLTTDSSGNVVARQLYDAWGNVRLKGDLKTDITFTGQRSNLDEIGLYYFKARYYASSLGRFVSADTIVPGPNNPQQLNRYAYALNSPVQYSDPSGMQ